MNIKKFGFYKKNTYFCKNNKRYKDMTTITQQQQQQQINREIDW